MLTPLTRTLLAAALLSASATLWPAAAWAENQDAATSVPASADASPPQTSPFVQHMQEAHRLIAEKDWPAATGAARKAVEAARQGENHYEEYDAVATLVRLLHRQQRYSDARREAEAQIVIFDKRNASEDATEQLLVMAVREAAAANEAADVARLQARIYAQGNAYPGLWTRDAAAGRLNYTLAGMSLPLATGRWALVSFKPADSRTERAQLDYMQTLDDGSALSARIWVLYREDLRAKDAQARRQALARRMGEPEGDQTPAPDTEAALPGLPFKDAVAAKRALQADYPGGKGIEAQWIAARGEWYVEARASFPQGKQDAAIAQLRELFDAMTWTGDVRLFRDKTMQEQDREIDSYWSMAHDWDQAAELSEAALPDAVFPLEIARLNTVIGRAAYDRDDLPEARRSLELALPAWAHASKAYHDESLYQTALDIAADVAYRQGRTQEAVALNRQFIQWVGSLGDGWSLAEKSPVVVYDDTGMTLPLRIGEFRLEPIDSNRFYYRNLKTGEQLGLALNQNAAVPDDKLEASMRSFIEDNLGLRILNLKTEAFAPHAQEGMKGAVQGRQYTFQVEAKPDDGRTISLSGPFGAPPAQMVFWVVDRDKRRSILRAPLPAEGIQTGVAQFVQTLAW
ncbi:hypothetical protein [Achromobacter kerstersii]|uniref:hypothetical protein n=1 Tax=Achromobacter kerstersii TaxID=1353890 RepID=UPI0012E28479|nr:hypothetical protein [Achromobacter kerstersii]